jgi:hypothetical protein
VNGRVFFSPALTPAPFLIRRFFWTVKFPSPAARALLLPRRRAFCFILILILVSSL